MSTSQNQTATPDHLHYEISQLEKMQRQIMNDMEALRVQESNLRAFESHLRETMPPMGAPSAPRSPATSGSLEAEWEKVRRSRTLLDAERRAFVDERALLREHLADLKQREDALTQRQAWVELRERELAAKPAAPAPVTKPPFSRSPFAAAKNFLSLRAAS
ncbi:MAG: hypothetical protein ACHQ5A_07950 [Opitutales bacterium]